MPRLRHRRTGVVIDVAEDRVRLLPAYEVVGGAAPVLAVEEKTAAVDPDEDEGYEGLTVLELKAEIHRRNQDRERGDKLSDDGKKVDLIARLVADDNRND